MPSTVGFFTGGFGPNDEQADKATSAQIDLSQEQAAIARQMADMAQGLYTTTNPLRQRGVNQLEAFLRAGTVPKALRMAYTLPYRTGREDLEAQFRNAREQIVSQSPTTGGQLNAMLGDLAMNRASSVGRLRSDLQTNIEAPMRQQLFSSALGTGFGQPPVAMSGLSSAMGGLGASASQFGSIATRAQAESLEREQRMKDEWAQVGSMAGMAFT